MVCVAKKKETTNEAGTISARPGPELRDAFAETLDSIDVSVNEAIKALMVHWLDASPARRVLIVKRLRARDLDQKLMALIESAQMNEVEGAVVSRLLDADREMQEHLQEPDDDAEAPRPKTKRPRKKK